MKVWFRRQYLNLLGRTKLVRDLRETIAEVIEDACTWRELHQEARRELKEVYHINTMSSPRVNAEVIRPVDRDDIHRVEIHLPRFYFTYTGGHTPLRDDLMAEQLTYRAIAYMQRYLPEQLMKQLGERR